MTSVVPHKCGDNGGFRCAKPPRPSPGSTVQPNGTPCEVLQKPISHPILHEGSNSPHDVPASFSGSGWIAETNKDEVIVTCRSLVHHRAKPHSVR
ncbi:hypothetical protein PpBr36_01609 [Pyricularia pennisetigena]|uniref:hypothetical protein n=1 Tax=Pyricularia pennisetigena TaxID=1578925 RepID=UPI0011518DE4|nr:hypothetical protein PpBr36_01609 [Pyricularia pennisetigena]TLS27911.1 hypothetical protein PpBr36_01609 [Pyricularia pennisetigena]